MILSDDDKTAKDKNQKTDLATEIVKSWKLGSSKPGPASSKRWPKVVYDVSSDEEVDEASLIEATERAAALLAKIRGQADASTTMEDVVPDEAPNARLELCGD